MTTQQLILMIAVYSVVLVTVAYFTRATAPRIAGALAGGATVGFLGLMVIALVERVGWWRVSISWTPHVVSLLHLAIAISCAPIYLVTWRVARRYGWRGLAVLLGAAAVVGPLRDYQLAAAFPEWIAFAPGIAPILAVAATYMGGGAVGHAVMYRIAGPARGDLLAERSYPPPNKRLHRSPRTRL
jgi:hypothetical protein